MLGVDTFSLEDEPVEFKQSLLLLAPGDCVLRDTDTPHGGTPNFSGTDRLMPCAMVYSRRALLDEVARYDGPCWSPSAPREGPVPRSLPTELYQALPASRRVAADYIHTGVAGGLEHTVKFRGS